jgi:hypothetical protein
VKELCLVESFKLTEGSTPHQDLGAQYPTGFELSNRFAFAAVPRDSRVLRPDPDEYGVAGACR